MVLDLDRRPSHVPLRERADGNAVDLGSDRSRHRGRHESPSIILAAQRPRAVAGNQPSTALAASRGPRPASGSRQRDRQPGVTCRRRTGSKDVPWIARPRRPDVPERLVGPPVAAELTLRRARRMPLRHLDSPGLQGRARAAARTWRRAGAAATDAVARRRRRGGQSGPPQPVPPDRRAHRLPASRALTARPRGDRVSFSATPGRPSAAPAVAQQPGRRQLEAVVLHRLMSEHGSLGGEDAPPEASQYPGLLGSGVAITRIASTSLNPVVPPLAWLPNSSSSTTCSSSRSGGSRRRARPAFPPGATVRRPSRTSTPSTGRLQGAVRLGERMEGQMVASTRTERAGVGSAEVSRQRAGDQARRMRVRSVWRPRRRRRPSSLARSVPPSMRSRARSSLCRSSSMREGLIDRRRERLRRRRW